MNLSVKDATVKSMESNRECNGHDVQEYIGEACRLDHLTYPESSVRDYTTYAAAFLVIKSLPVRAKRSVLSWPLLVSQAHQPRAGYEELVATPHGLLMHADR